MSVDEMSRLLSESGGRPITAEQVQADVDAGAPIGPDGKMSLVDYAAWLVREVQKK
jgi:hypothetical protein